MSSCGVLSASRICSSAAAFIFRSSERSSQVLVLLPGWRMSDCFQPTLALPGETNTIALGRIFGPNDPCRSCQAACTRSLAARRASDEDGGISSSTVSFSPWATSSALRAANACLARKLWRTMGSAASPAKARTEIKMRRFSLVITVDWTTEYAEPHSRMGQYWIWRGRRPRSPLQKIIPLFFTDGPAQFFEHLKHVLPDFALLTERLVPQQIRRVIRGHDRHTAKLLPMAAQFGDAAGLAEQTFQRRGAERHDHLRLNDTQLRQQIRQTGLHLFRRRLAVAYRLPGRIRSALQNVGDVNCVAREAHRLNDPGKKLAGLADKRFALLIFVRARRLAHKHERRMNVADAEHHVPPRRSEVRAFPTDHCARAQLRQRGFFGFSTGWRRGGGCRKRRFGILRRS